ncbi:hypothetical protein EGH25_03800 [Haladaptatus sp. F3-133]|uniref:Uncharacterized protein n=1 Tax=Halorutilus salinus TaxID=2487751 RepID=A0A9Q4C3L5_9EURY|nr:hypothetical protein [Halorutilus salinus]MCX2818477.1 hypothetical protein [Halorutilus salinus]
MSKKDTEFEDGTITVTYREDDGEVDRRRLAGIMGAATTATMVLLIVTLSLGMVGAAMGVGLGGFVANFDKVNTTSDASIYPVLGEQAACTQAPQLEATLAGTAEITSTSEGTPAVEFFKDLPLPSNLWYDGDFARITIAANGSDTSPIEAENLDLRLSALEANSLNLGDGNIAEFSTGNLGDSPEDSYERADALNESSSINATDTIGSGSFAGETEFGISAGSFEILGGTAAAHQVAFDSINLQDINLAVQIVNNTDNAVVSPSTPTESDCHALSDYAELNDQPYTGNQTDMTSTSEAGIQLDDETAVTEDDGKSPRSNNNTQSLPFSQP